MGKLLLLLIAGLSFGISTAFYSIQSGVLTGEHEVYQYAEEAMAREQALTGLNDAAQVVFEHYEKGTPPPKKAKGKDTYGSYEVEINAPSGSKTFTLTSIGTIDDVKYTVKRTYTYTQPSGIPPFARNAISTKGNILANNQFEIRAAPTENANIHANGDIKLSGSGLNKLVEGFGSYKGNLESNTSAAHIFKPHVNPDGLPVAKKTSELNIPPFDAAIHKSKATQVKNGSWSVGGTVKLGTKEKPEIIYVDGDVTTTSPVTFEGYGILMVTGNFQAHHSVTQDHDPKESRLGIYAKGNIYLHQNGLDLAGFWFINGNVNFMSGIDTVQFSGAITNSGNLEIYNNNFSMHYLRPSPTITNPIWPPSGPGGLVLNTAQEWGKKPTLSPVK